LGHATDRRLAHARITAVSDKSAAAFLALRASSGAPPPPEAPRVIYNGVDSPSRPGPIAPLPAGSVIRCVYGGRFEWEKGTDLLPEILALTRLPSGCTGHLTVFGAGRHARLLRQLETNPPLGWRVSCKPAIADFATRLTGFDVALLPSRHEGLALVAIEALLAGIQVVATSAAGLQEALPPGHRWLARPDDPADFAENLSAACASRAEWPGLAMAGQRFAMERFNLKKMADGYRALYRELAAKVISSRAQ
jgi:glycosyltransferase involved in cell wall biosynthesis